MSDDRDTVLTNYIEKVEQVRAKHNRGLGTQELHAIAREIGISEQDLRLAHQHAQEHLTRGKNFFNYERWDDAIVELQDAVTLSPSWLEAKHMLASAYQKRYEKSGDQSDHYEASRLARECLNIDPSHGPSVQILNALDHAPRALAPRAQARPPGAQPYPNSAPHHVNTQPSSGGGNANSLVLAVVGAVICLMISGVVFFILLLPQDMPSARPEIHHEVRPNAPISNRPISAKPTSPPTTSKYGTDYIDVPGQLSNSTQAELRSELELSEVRRYRSSGSRFYNAQLRITNTSKGRTLTKIKIKLDLYDKQNKLITSKNNTPLGVLYKKLHPGDSLAYSRVVKLTGPEVGRAAIEITKADSIPAPSLDFKELKGAADNVRMPPGVKLKLYEQGLRHFGSSKRWTSVAYIIENTGTSPAGKVHLSTKFYDKNDNLLDTVDRSTRQEAVTIKPGERRLFRTASGHPKSSPQPTRYEVRVTEVEAPEKR